MIALGLPCCVRAFSRCSEQASSHGTGFSCCGVWALKGEGFTSCGTNEHFGGSPPGHVNQQQGALFPAAPQEATAILNVVGYCFTEPGLELRLPDFFFFFF